MNMTVERLNEADGKWLSAKIKEEFRLREDALKVQGLRSLEGVVTLGNNKIRGMVDGKD